MRQTIYILTTSFLLTNCDNSPKGIPEATVTDSVNHITLTDLKKDFKYSNLTKFEIDTFTWETRPGKYKELDSTTFYMVWQDKKRHFSGQGYDRDYLFSWQDRDTNFIEFTILTQDEGDYCDLITYFIFDKNGKVIDQFVTSSKCGDGGWTFDASGQFTDNRTFEILCIETEIAGIDTLDNTELFEGDSTLYHFIINSEGKVKQKEIYKRPFNDKN
jgi:hypothetical protein